MWSPVKPTDHHTVSCGNSSSYDHSAFCSIRELSFGSNALQSATAATESNRGAPPIDLAFMQTADSPFQVEHQQQHQQHQQQSLANSERDLIIVRRVRSLDWSTDCKGADRTVSIEYECRVCNRVCKWRSSISVHVRTHTGQKPYSCRACDQSFADSSTRKKHEKKAHNFTLPNTCNRFKPISNARIMKSAKTTCWLCSFCPLSLDSRTELTKHISETHQIGSADAASSGKLDSETCVETADCCVPAGDGIMDTADHPELPKQEAIPLPSITSPACQGQQLLEAGTTAQVDDDGLMICANGWYSHMLMDEP